MKRNASTNSLANESNLGKRRKKEALQKKRHHINAVDEFYLKTCKNGVYKK